jgi:hypothetical protein
METSNFVKDCEFVLAVIHTYMLVNLKNIK